MLSNVPQNGKLPDEDLWFRIYSYDDFFWKYIQDKGNTSLFDHYPIPEGFDIRSLTALHYGAVAWVDNLVGRLCASLGKNNLAHVQGRNLTPILINQTPELDIYYWHDEHSG